jgi:hypothetical protein
MLSELILPLAVIYNITELHTPDYILIYMSMEPWRNDNDRVKTKNAEKNLSQCHFVNHKFHTDWPRCNPGPLWWETGD